MFVQIHMLQSMPPGNLNRDDTGQPKKCIFGGVTRGRISSQCLKRHIRRSEQFSQAFGDALANRTTYLPRMIADSIRSDETLGIPEDEIDKLVSAIASRFKKDKKGTGDEDTDESDAASDSSNGNGQTGQLVFFPPTFAKVIASILAVFRRETPEAYRHFAGLLTPKPQKTQKEVLDVQVKSLIQKIATASKSLTVDIGLFGRMTTSDLVVNVEATCQVAHAFSTHETIIESDWFTAMDDSKHKFVSSQTDRAGAAFMGSGETQTFYNASVYYKYLNLDLDALREHLSIDSKPWPDSEARSAVRALVSAAALATPTGKQNSFASFGVPELILVEVSKVKRPISYANAFLEPADGPNYMANSAKALKGYVEAIAAAYSPADTKRFQLSIGNGATEIGNAEKLDNIDALADTVASAAVAK